MNTLTKTKESGIPPCICPNCGKEMMFGGDHMRCYHCSVNEDHEAPISKGKHTPGPWKVNAIDIRDRIIGDASVSQGVNKYQINNYNATVATTYRPTDARLITAAPELLEAAKEILANGYDVGRRIALRAAVAKAEGK